MVIYEAEGEPLLDRATRSSLLCRVCSSAGFLYSPASALTLSVTLPFWSTFPSKAF